MEKISVIVPMYNAGDYIQTCLDSVAAQSYPGWELLVIDDGSLDQGPALCQAMAEKDSRVRLIHQENQGVSAARNRGLAAAEGGYLFFLDSDQWASSETYLDNALEILDRERHIGAVGWAAGWFSPGECTGPISDYYPNRAIESPRVLFRSDIAYLGSGGLLLKKALFEEIGGFDENYDPTCFEDTDLSLKIRHAGYELAYCPYIGLMHLPHQTTQSGSSAHAKLIKEHGAYFMEKWQELEPTLLEYYI